ncbi:hypothetical protein WMF37_37715 [Sorangium sp. So ce291]|uniref:hypothetical protein n=1 Tax=Sorangium sp. So ce291 TaxID=3133294 RepID=UPI003F633D20
MTASFDTTNALFVQGESPSINGLGFKAGANVKWTIQTSGNATGVSLSNSSVTADGSGKVPNSIVIASTATANSTWTLSATDGTNSATTLIMVAHGQATGQDLIIYDEVGTAKVAYLITRATANANARFCQLGAVPSIVSSNPTAMGSVLVQIPSPTTGASCVSCYVLNLTNIPGWIPHKEVKRPA